MRYGGGMLSFILKGGADEARRVAESTRLFALAESLGGVESLIEALIVMTNSSIANSALAIDSRLVHISVGIENVVDLLADLDQAL